MAKRSKRAGKSKKPDRYAKQKMLAIPLLLVVLGYVLVDNFGGGSNEPQATTTPAKTNAHVETSVAAVAESKTEDKRQVAWPKPQLDFLNGPSPFASYRQLSGAIARPTTSVEGMLVAQQQAETIEQIENIRETLATQPSQFVFKTANRKLALVGDRIIQQGEQLGSGASLHDVRGSNLVIQVGRRID